MLLGGIEIPTWIGLSLVAAVLAYLYGTRNHGFFKKLGISGPKPSPFLGNVVGSFTGSAIEVDKELRRKYGKFVGTFELNKPVLVVFDGKWAKEAFIKNFAKTSQRRQFNMGGVTDSGVFSLEGEHWKSSRTALTPSFTQGKLKQMVPAINRCEKVFISVLEGTSGEPVEIRSRINALTMDVIATTAFGIQTDSQTNPDSRFFKNAMMLAAGFQDSDGIIAKIKTFINTVLLFFGNRRLLKFLEEAFGFTTLDYGSLMYFTDMCDSIMKSRPDTESSHGFVQSLADKVVEAPENEPDTLVDEAGLRWTRKGLTRREILGNAVLFFFAGFGTTADSMLYVFYELAHHPDIQEKLYGDIETVCDTEEITMEQVGQLPYLEWCINEAMRMYPQVGRVERQVSEDLTVHGLTVPKGSLISVSVNGCHRDPDIWEDPEAFIPDRFSPENMSSEMSSAFIPFGIGNRFCIGNRLALLEIKLTMINVLKHFRIEKCDQTPSRPLKLKPILSPSPANPIYVRLIKRI